MALIVDAPSCESRDHQDRLQQGQAALDESLRMGETRATLDPGSFSEARVRKAYQVAREIPWVLDSIYCFCYCKESPAFRHKSLLSCFTDYHGAG